jgi:hypothetical protein
MRTESGYGSSTPKNQAKGRIERLGETMQVWFALNGIAAMEQANALLPRFIAELSTVPPETGLPGPHRLCAHPGGLRP